MAYLNVHIQYMYMSTCTVYVHVGIYMYRHVLYIATVSSAKHYIRLGSHSFTMHMHMCSQALS